MIGIVFFLEEAYSTLCTAFVGDVMSELTYDARQLGATHIFVIDKTGGKGQFYNHADGEIQLEFWNSLAELEAAYPDPTFVYLENAKTFIAGKVDHSYLQDYVHPADAIYITGPNSGIEDVLINKSGDFVCIKDIEDIWSKTALMLCLYHRRIS